MGFFVSAEETVKRLYINKPASKNNVPADSSNAPAPANTSKDLSPTEPPAAAPLINLPQIKKDDVEKLIAQGPFEVFANPKFRKFLEFLTNKKMIVVLNDLANKDKMKFMAIGQLLLVLFTIFLRSMVTANSKGFMSVLLANTWIAALHVFLALVVLPRFLYGPHYFDLVSELYKVITTQT